MPVHTCMYLPVSVNVYVCASRWGCVHAHVRVSEKVCVREETNLLLQKDESACEKMTTLSDSLMVAASEHNGIDSAEGDALK